MMQETRENSQYPIVKKLGEKPSSVSGSVGILLLHGFTSHTKCVSGLIPYLEEAELPYEMPWLRGHGTKPEDLCGVTADMWYEDACAALDKLSERVDHVIVVGLSMGGLMALNLCAKRAEKIIACVTWAAALAFKNPLSGLIVPLSHLFKMWPGQESFNDPECRKANANYSEFPTKAFASLYQYAKETQKILSQVNVPFCAIQSTKDQVIPYKMSELQFNTVTSSYRELVTLERSGHELGQDCEAKIVFEQTMRFIAHFVDVKHE